MTKAETVFKIITKTLFKFLETSNYYSGKYLNDNYSSKDKKEVIFEFNDDSRIIINFNNNSIKQTISIKRNNEDLYKNNKQLITDTNVKIKIDDLINYKQFSKEFILGYIEGIKNYLSMSKECQERIISAINQADKAGILSNEK